MEMKMNSQFLTEFSQNFIEQVNRVFDFDGYLIYSIDNINRAYNYHNFNISHKSLTEYLDHKVENDPVSFKNFYLEKNNHVELLSLHKVNEAYSDFMQRWQVKDTAEIFFRKRNGDPILGMSIVREKTSHIFTHQDKMILESFYHLSKSYFYNQTDKVDKHHLINQYHLTKKEIIVLEQILNGLNNHAISSNLNCSLATVKTHIQHLYQKINVKNRQEIICKFLK